MKAALFCVPVHVCVVRSLFHPSIHSMRSVWHDFIAHWWWETECWYQLWLSGSGQLLITPLWPTGMALFNTPHHWTWVHGHILVLGHVCSHKLFWVKCNSQKRGNKMHLSFCYILGILADILKVTEANDTDSGCDDSKAAYSDLALKCIIQIRYKGRIRGRVNWWTAGFVQRCQT